jgi:hypothetical protein
MNGVEKIQWPPHGSNDGSQSKDKPPTGMPIALSEPK